MNDTRKLARDEMAEIDRMFGRAPIRPRPAEPIRRTTVFMALFCGALLGFLICLDPMGLYVAEVLK